MFRIILVEVLLRRCRTVKKLNCDMYAVDYNLERKIHGGAEKHCF